jgi:hypothetical protein
MGNLITCARLGDDRDLHLSNGSTDVLLTVLLLSGSALAASTWERELMTWLAEHDQGVFGAGMVGFDLDEIAWSADGFDVQRAFVLRTIDLALTRHRWDELSYDPPFVADQLRALRALVTDFRPDPAATAVTWSWMSPPRQLTLCDRHAVYVHDHGCLICHDGA